MCLNEKLHDKDLTCCLSFRSCLSADSFSYFHVYIFSEILRLFKSATVVYLHPLQPACRLVMQHKLSTWFSEDLSKKCFVYIECVHYFKCAYQYILGQDVVVWWSVQLSCNPKATRLSPGYIWKGIRYKSIAKSLTRVCSL